MDQDYIQLPDGRRFTVQDLTNRVTNRRLQNLRARRHRQPPRLDQSRLRYTPEERLWQSQADPEDIREKYGISLTQARNLRSHARYIQDLLARTRERLTDNGEK